MDKRSLSVSVVLGLVVVSLAVSVRAQPYPAPAAVGPTAACAQWGRLVDALLLSGPPPCPRIAERATASPRPIPWRSTSRASSDR